MSNKFYFAKISDSYVQTLNSLNYSSSTLNSYLKDCYYSRSKSDLVNPFVFCND
jgi:hypothetical protein